MSGGSCAAPERIMDARPVGAFDSGVGGADFVFLGDHARVPYGPRPLEEIRRFSREIAVGEYRFLTQLPMRGVEHVTVATVEGATA